MTILSILTFLSHSQTHICIIRDTDHLFIGEEQRHHLQSNQSLRHQEEELHVKDAMGQLPTPVKSVEDHSQNVNGTMDVNQTSDNEKKDRYVVPTL